MGRNPSVDAINLAIGVSPRGIRPMTLRMPFLDTFCATPSARAPATACSTFRS